MIQKLISDHIKMIQKFDSALLDEIQLAADLVHAALKSNQTIYLIGNGGSAADCQHVAAEFIGRFQMNRPALSAQALTTDTSVLTSIGNDFGFEHVFSRQIEGIVKEGDIVFAFSTSGNSQNILNGIEAAIRRGAKVVGFTGINGGQMVTSCDVCIQVPSINTARIQEAHILISHIICETVEISMFEMPLC